MRKKWMNLKLLVAMMLSIVLSSSLVCYAATPENALAQMTSYRISDYLTEEDMSFLNKLTFLYEDFELDDEGSLEINKTYNEIQKKSGFSDEEMIRFQKMMDYSSQNPVGNKIGEETPTPRLHAENWKVYFTYDDVATYLSAAAAIGPAAVTAALSALASAVGPVGTVIGGILGYVVSADLCYLVIQAGALQKGIYIGVDWNGPFPVYTQGLW